MPFFSPHTIHKQGFSLLEVVIVLAILGILVVVAGPQWPGGVFIQAQAEQLAQDIRYTQALAMGLKADNMGNGTFVIQRAAENSYKILDQNGNILLSYPLVWEGVTLSSFIISFSYPMGSPGLVDTAIHLAAGDEFRNLVVLGLTGAVIIQP